MAWTIAPEVLRVLRERDVLTVDFFKAIFGSDGEQVSNWPNSIAAKLSGGITAQDFADNIAFGASLQLGTGGVTAKKVIEATVRGILTGWYDVTAFGAVTGDSANQTDNYNAIMAASAAAYGNPGGGGVVWFPKTHEDGGSGLAYYFDSGANAGANGLGIYPGLIYRSAPGVILKRTGTSSHTDYNQAIFTTMPGGSVLASFANKTTVFDGLTLNCEGPTSSHNVSGFVFAVATSGTSFLIRNCRVINAKGIIAGSVARYGIVSGSSLRTIVRNCHLTNCEQGVSCYSDLSLVTGCSIDMTVTGVSQGIIGLSLASGVGNNMLKQVDNCTIGGNTKGTATGILVTGASIGMATVLGNTLTPTLAEAGGSLKGITANDWYVSIIGNRIAPDMSSVNVLDDMDVGIDAMGGQCCIVGNTVSNEHHGTKRITKGINTINSTLNRVSGNILAGGEGSFTTPISMNAPGSATSDMYCYDKNMNNVCMATDGGIGLVGAPAFEPMGSGLSSYVNVLHATKGHLYAGGIFTNAGHRVANSIAKWSGANWEPWRSSGFNGEVSSILRDGRNMWVGGAFTTPGQIAYSDDDGVTVTAPSPLVYTGYPAYTWSGVTALNGTTPGYVKCIVKWNDWIVVAGKFQRLVWLSGTTRYYAAVNNIFMFHPHTGAVYLMGSTLWNGTSVGTSASNGPGLVDADYILTVVPNGKDELLIGGRFKNIGAHTRGSLEASYSAFYWNMARYVMADGVGSFVPLAPVVYSPANFANVSTIYPINGHTILVGGYTGPGSSPYMVGLKNPRDVVVVKQKITFAAMAMVRDPSAQLEDYDKISKLLNLNPSAHGDVFYPRYIDGMSRSAVYCAESVPAIDGDWARVILAREGGVGYVSFRVRGDTDSELGRMNPILQYVPVEMPFGTAEYTSIVRYKGAYVIAGDFHTGFRSGSFPNYVYSPDAYGQNMNLVVR